jgi:hypothetical protein
LSTWPGSGEAGKHDQLVTARLAERAHPLAHLVLALGDARHDHGGVVAQDRVVVADRLAGLGLGVVVQREVGEGHPARLAFASLGLPGRVELLGGLWEHLRRGAAHHPAVAVLRGAAEHGVRAAAHDYRRRVVGDVGPHPAGVAAFLARPEPLDVVEHPLHFGAAAMEVGAGGLVVVLAAAHSHAEHEPAAGEGVQRRGLLGDDRCADA